MFPATLAQGAGELFAGGEGRGRWWVVGLAYTRVLPRGCDGVKSLLAELKWLTIQRPLEGLSAHRA